MVRVTTDDGILAQLSSTVGKLDTDRGVLTRSRHREVPGQSVGSHILAEPFLLGDRCGAKHFTGGDVIGGVELGLVFDQNVRHEPVDLVPGFRDLRRDGITQHIDDGGHEVVMDDLILVGGDAE